MNKLFSKIGVAIVGMAMAIGVGVALCNSISIAPANAAETSDGNGGYYDTFGTGAHDSTEKTITWTMADGNITMVQSKNTGTDPNVSYITAARVYNKNILTFSAVGDYRITKIEITVSSTYYGAIVAGTTYTTEDGYNTVIENDVDITAVLTNTSGGTHSFTCSAGLSTVYLHQTSATQLRWANGGVKVYYTKPAASGSITGVSIDGVNNNSMIINSGYLNRKVVQLSATVSQSGSGLSSNVTWSSADSTKMSVDEDGLVTIKSNDTVRITATSVADDDYSDYVDITSSGLATFSGTTTSTNFDTTDMGNQAFQSTTSGSPVSIAGAMENVTVVVDKNDNNNNPGFYLASNNNPTGVRVYGAANSHNTMTISAPATNKLFWIDFTSVEGNEMTSTNTTITSGSGSLRQKGTATTIDCTASAVNSITLSFNSQVRLSAMSISYGADTLSTISVDVSEAISTSFPKDSTFTSSIASANNIFAYANYAGGSRVDVTSTATWNLDTSETGTKPLTATYGGKTSAGVNVTIVGGIVLVDTITVTPASTSGLYIGQTVQLSATVTGVGGEDPTNDTVSWSTGNADVATVDSEGLVTAKGVGSTTITASANDTSGVTGTATVTIVDFPTFTKVTSTDELFNGMTVVIASYDGTKLLSTTQNSNNRGYVASSLNESVITPSIIGYAELTLGVEEMDNGTIVYSFYDSSNEGYLYAASSSANHLKTQASLNNNGRFTITFGSKTINKVNYENSTILTAQGSNTRNEMRYNTSNNFFACYASDSDTGVPVGIYVKTGQAISAEQRVNTFIAKYMKMNSYDKGGTIGSEDGTGLCSTFYPTARDAFNSNTLMNATARAAFFNEENTQWDDARARLSEWARIKGDSFNGTTNILESGRGGIAPTVIESKSSATLIIVAASIVSLTAIGGYFFIRRRKQD